jgi:hypothetical protein
MNDCDMRLAARIPGINKGGSGLLSSRDVDVAPAMSISTLIDVVWMFTDSSAVPVDSSRTKTCVA